MKKWRQLYITSLCFQACFITVFLEEKFELHIFPHAQQFLRTHSSFRAFREILLNKHSVIVNLFASHDVGLEKKSCPNNKAIHLLEGNFEQQR